eukprot:TRINITY_DN92721_c0_g1_i1.p1 TRINITY_DN92721_c0_g1~~TRINITY_DN92721_c0_g1_i1.p1  ORF type:complete len:337 (+),score=50.11 TRINITY_DN92721_c0_g1_i1:97-1107(+)
MPAKVQATPDELMEDCEKAAGAADTHKMPDGWVIHSETWEPVGEARAVVLHAHGWMESTQTLGMRRIAKACLARSIVLLGYDQHGHGLSLEKNGKAMSDRKRGVLESVAVLGDHMVEMAKYALNKYKLPLIIMGHSLGADGCVLATKRIAEACKAQSVPFVCAAYVAVPLSATPQCCGVGGIKCCAACCCPCSFLCGCSVPKNFAADFNPGLMFGSPDRNASRIYPYRYCVDVCLPSGRGGTPDWPTLLKAIDIGVKARVFFGDKDEHWKAEWKTKLPNNGDISLEVWPGVTHDCLSVDPKSMECISNIFAYIDDRLCGKAEKPEQVAMTSELRHA